MFADPWTDSLGLVHIREPGTGNTVCGEHVGLYSDTRPVEVCEDCVTRWFATSYVLSGNDAMHQRHKRADA